MPHELSQESSTSRAFAINCQPRAEESRLKGVTRECEEQAYAALKEGLFSGRYLPGERLVERDIATNLAMSRTPVRTALRQLENEGFLERLGSRGYRVRVLDVEGALAMLDVREALEGMAARLAAQNATDEQRQELLGILEAMQTDVASGSCLHYYSLCGDLHRCVFRASGNPMLENMVVQVNALSARFHYKTLLLAERVRKSVQEHKTIVQHIVAGDAESAERLTREHVRTVKGLIECFARVEPGLDML